MNLDFLTVEEQVEISELTAMSDSEKLNFSQKFLRKFLENGFGTLPKREIEILVFHLLYKESSFFRDKSNYEMANLLKISETRIKSLKSEANLKYQRLGNKDALRQIAENLFITKSIHFELHEDIIQFYLEDPSLMREFIYSVKQLGYSTDTSFNNEIVKVKSTVFLNIFITNFDQTEDLFGQVVKETNLTDKQYQKILDKTQPREKRLHILMQNYGEPVNLIVSFLSLIL